MHIIYEHIYKLFLIENFAECGGETTIKGRWMGWIVLHERLRGGMGICGGIWVRRMGKHAQLHPTS